MPSLMLVSKSAQLWQKPALISWTTRPIVAKFQSWKQKEAVIKEARKLKPQDVKFVEDFSQKTLLRRNQQIPDLKKARDDGKIAFFVGGNFVIKDKPPDRFQRVESDEEEITFSNTAS